MPTCVSVENVENSHYIDTFGRNLTERYLIDAISTISTGILSITASKIWNASTVGNICRTICEKGSKIPNSDVKTEQLISVNELAKPWHASEE